jgi:GAF domain-containing protein
MISTNRLANAFVEVADTLVADFDLMECLHNITHHAAAMIDHSAVGLLLADATGKLTHVAASTEDAETLELFQLQHDEGPCIDCVRSGAPVYVTDLSLTTARWPRFAPRAADAGIQSVHAFPLRLREQVIGALNIFGREPTPLSPTDIPLLQSLADIGTIAILQEQALRRAEALTEQLQFALNSRVVIEQAKGAVARALDIGVDEAFDLLRAHARARRVRLTDLAYRVVTDRAAMDELRSAR